MSLFMFFYPRERVKDPRSLTATALSRNRLVYAHRDNAELAERFVEIARRSPPIRDGHYNIGPQTMKVFAVIRTRGPAWQPSSPLEGQRDWDAHARFMDELQTAGIVILGGPLEGTSDVLLIMQAATSDEVANQLAADPWTELDLLRTERIVPWVLRLGTLSSTR